MRGAPSILTAPRHLLVATRDVATSKQSILEESAAQATASGLTDLLPSAYAAVGPSTVYPPDLVSPNAVTVASGERCHRNPVQTT